MRHRFVALIGFTIRICELRLYVLVLYADAVVGLVADDCALLEHVAVLLRILFDTYRRQQPGIRCVGTHCKLRRDELLLIAAGGHHRMEQLQAVRFYPLRFYS